MRQILSILFFLSVLTGHSQTEKHPIDTRNSACHDIDTNQTTYGMMQCEAIARDEWFLEMDKYYNLLLDTLSEESVTLLRASQEAWLDYNMKEKSFSSSLYYSDMDGTMWYVVNAGRMKDIIRKRALELKDYYETYTYVGM